jgi:hypothetical protein
MKALGGGEVSITGRLNFDIGLFSSPVVYDWGNKRKLPLGPINKTFQINHFLPRERVYKDRVDTQQS